MADKYLTPEQKAEFIKNLESQGGVPDGGALSPEEQQQAIQEGAQMAAADAQNGSVPGAEPPVEQSGAAAQQESADAQALSQLGFSSMDELVNAYRETMRTQSELREMLTNLVAVQQAAGNEEQLDPNNPDDRMAAIARREMQPLLEKQKADIRNRLIQEKWSASEAAKAADLSNLMPEIQAYLTANPKYAVDEDGLQRAYDAVRSKRYRSEEALMNDPDFLKRAASNEQVYKEVIEDYLQKMARNGEAVPQPITDGGSTPLSGKKTVSGMENARQKLLSMLGTNN